MRLAGGLVLLHGFLNVTPEIFMVAEPRNYYGSAFFINYISNSVGGFVVVKPVAVDSAQVAHFLCPVRLGHRFFDAILKCFNQGLFLDFAQLIFCPWQEYCFIHLTHLIVRRISVRPRFLFRLQPLSEPLQTTSEEPRWHFAF